MLRLVERAHGVPGTPEPTDALTIRRLQDEAAGWIRAESNLDALLKTSGATRLAWYRLHENGNEPMADTLARGLSVKPIPNSTLLEVSVTDPDAEAAAEMCNYVMQHCAHRSRLSAPAGTVDQGLLTQELERIHARLSTIAGAMQEIRRSTDFENLDRRRGEIADRVVQLRTLRMTQELQVANLERLVQLGSTQPDVLNELDAARAKLKEISADLTASEERKRKLDTVGAQSQGMQLELEQLEADRKRLEDMLKPLPMELPANHPPVAVFSNAAVPRER